MGLGAVGTRWRRTSRQRAAGTTCGSAPGPTPTPRRPPVRFAAIGDYGVGIRADSESSRRQRRIADVVEALVAEHDVRFVLSLGDNVYQGEDGRVDQEGGGEDDDWYSSFFQPYRLAIARVPVFPAIGNHDSADAEGSDDRAQMEDNFHIRERFHHGFETASVSPGLFYRLRYGSDLGARLPRHVPRHRGRTYPPLLPGTRAPGLARGDVRRPRDVVG